MSFREFNQKFLEPGAQWLMIVGIVSLCQPWIPVLHLYSVAIMLVGLIAFNVAAHVPPPVGRMDKSAEAAPEAADG
jgi:hypothetical protein